MVVGAVTFCSCGKKINEALTLSGVTEELTSFKGGIVVLSLSLRTPKLRAGFSGFR